MTDRRENIARALWAAADGSRVEWDESNDWWREKYLTLADAAIAADDLRAQVEALAKELDEDSRTALDQADIADMRGDLEVRRIYVRHARVTKHAAAAIRAALAGT